MREGRQVRSTPASPAPADIALGDHLDAITNLNDRMADLGRILTTRNTVQRLGADVRAFPTGPAGAAGSLIAISAKISSSPGRLAGLTVRETTGTAGAVLRVHDGYDTTGDLLQTIDLAPGASASPWFGDKGIAFTLGLYLEIVTGAVEGSLFIGARQ